MEKRSLQIEIGNLTEAQAIAIEDMLATWVRLSGLGGSRWTAFYADGDGNFHPKISVNGAKPKKTDLLSVEETWPDGHHGEYRIDFDWIAWKLHKEPTAPRKEAPMPADALAALKDAVEQARVEWNRDAHIIVADRDVARAALAAAEHKWEEEYDKRVTLNKGFNIREGQLREARAQFAGARDAVQTVYDEFKRSRAQDPDYKAGALDALSQTRVRIRALKSKPEGRGGMDKKLPKWSDLRGIYADDPSDDPAPPPAKGEEATYCEFHGPRETPGCPECHVDEGHRAGAAAEREAILKRLDSMARMGSSHAPDVRHFNDALHGLRDFITARVEPQATPQREEE